MVVRNKVAARIAADIQGELDTVSQAVTARARQLEDRYDASLAQLTTLLQGLKTRVDEHLESLSSAWN